MWSQDGEDVPRGEQRMSPGTSSDVHGQGCSLLVSEEIIGILPKLIVNNLSSIRPMHSS